MVQNSSYTCTSWHRMQRRIPPENDHRGEQSNAEQTTATRNPAAFMHVLVPECFVLAATTVRVLHDAAAAGVQVIGVGNGPEWVETDTTVDPVGILAWESVSTAVAVAALPRLVVVGPASDDIRCTAWERDGSVTRLLMNIGAADCDVTVDGNLVHLRRGEVITLESA